MSHKKQSLKMWYCFQKKVGQYATKLKIKDYPSPGSQCTKAKCQTTVPQSKIKV